MLEDRMWIRGRAAGLVVLVGGRGAHRRLRALPSLMDTTWSPMTSHATHLELVAVLRSPPDGPEN